MLNYISDVLVFILVNVKLAQRDDSLEQKGKIVRYGRVYVL